MKSFACGSVVPGCAQTFTADDEDAVLALVAGHASADHGLVQLPAALVAEVRSRMTTVS